ncbi:MAG: cell division ATPase MinD [Candidatus Aenigmarchaeota archaeon]|nr:cell division ATPase MinD [Candidatus Aenigmarchaeota archaeon]
MTAILSILSAKGGVGKTTTTVNLAAALAQRGLRIIAVDGNITTPNLGMHLGIPLYPKTLHDVFAGKARMTEAMYIHPSGIRVVPASLSAARLKSMTTANFQKSLLQLVDKSGIILVDGAAGLGSEARAAMHVSDSIIIVTNPELPAVTDALKAIKIANKKKTSVMGIVVNRVSKRRHELSIDEIRLLTERPIIGIIPEDPEVPRSIAVRLPVVHYKPRSPSAVAYKNLASNLLGEPQKETIGLFNYMFSWFRR